MTGAFGSTGDASGSAVGATSAATTGSGHSGSSNNGAANAATSSGRGATGAGSGSGHNLVAQLASGSSGHLAGVPDSVSMEVVAGLLLMGGVAFGPTWRRQRAKSRIRATGSHFRRD
ncbi:MAG: hypothetical protein QOG97_1768 [Acidimicrobiaceae bacterium]|nr:hypothetical protein [Acidimicrobiaceae bacterium]